MNLFSISQLEQYSGIKAHTIRIWEKRYNALKPKRSDGNTRYYDNEQLRRLLNIASFQGQTYKISEICKLTDQELHALTAAKILKESNVDNEANYYITQLLEAGVGYNEIKFNTVYRACLDKFGLLDTYSKIIHPLLVRIGLMWTSDALSIPAEHYISYLIRQKIINAIEQLPAASEDAKNWLLFLPEDETHEMGLFMAHYLLKANGFRVINLGGNLPFATLEKVVDDVKPNNILFFLVHRNTPKHTELLLQQVTQFKTKIYIAANKHLLSQIKPREHVVLLNSLDAFSKILNKKNKPHG